MFSGSEQSRSGRGHHPRGSAGAGAVGRRRVFHPDRLHGQSGRLSACHQGLEGHGQPGGRQPLPAAVAQRLALLHALPGQSVAVGNPAGRPRRVPPEPQHHPEEVGLPRAHIWAWGVATGTGPLSEGGPGFQVSREGGDAGTGVRDECRVAHLCLCV